MNANDPSDDLAGSPPPTGEPPPLPPEWSPEWAQARAGAVQGERPSLPPIPPPSSPPPLPGPLKRPRVWTVFATIACGMGGATVIGLVFAVAASAVMLASGKSEDEIGAWMEGGMASPWGLILTAVVGQAAFLAATLGAAWRSRVGVRERLGLVKGRIGVWAAPVFMVGTIFVMFNAMIGAGMLLGVPSDEMDEFQSGVSQSTGLTAVLVLLAISILPGFTEELLFRGYAQRRLIERWGPWVGIGLTSLMFAAVHIDWRHAATVLPLGVWLGVIAWRTGAVWPGMVCHFGNNFIAVLLAHLAGATPEDGVSEQMGVMFAGAWLLTGTAFVGSVLVLVFAGQRGSATVRA